MVARDLRGRFLFGSDVTYCVVVKKVKLTEDFDYEVFQVSAPLDGKKGGPFLFLFC